jgi:hypothetical protein
VAGGQVAVAAVRVDRQQLQCRVAQGPAARRGGGRSPALRQSRRA